ncbi:Fic family protein [Rickettsiales bacterium]|nr:Fic family protein [Rickettsiales bacterium]
MSWKNFRINKRLNLKPEIIEEVYSLIAKVDTVKNSFSLTNNLLPQTINRLTSSLIVTSAGSSNRIEGNKLTDNQVEKLYKNLNIQKFKTRDEQEVAGYIEVLQEILANYQNIKISESIILGFHDQMLKYSDKDLRHKGGYKFGQNRVEAKDHEGNLVGVIFDPTPPYLVKKEIQELVEWYNYCKNEGQKHPLILISNFIFEYLAIHPFQDGNGRTSRLLTNLMLLQSGYNFTNIVSHEKLIENNKADYYLALNKTQKTWKSENEDISKWLLFFLKIVNGQAQKALDILKGETIEYLLSEKQLHLWNWALSLDKKEFSRKDAIEETGFPARTVESIIKKLFDLKKLERIGEGRGIRYKVLR